ncbi:hypothetical protein BP5796_04884 [Coleophoma crateriformis]|uniref:Uncharacterized protein n=1 Tax=Coleophoma crateriformis TaxID=565419 RepID=A0A3D8SAU9_9HELO|nr:hypothetical protein BP5796_04884 [Coleophoma crateriformis]
MVHVDQAVTRRCLGTTVWQKAREVFVLHTLPMLEAPTKNEGIPRVVFTGKRRHGLVSATLDASSNAARTTSERGSAEVGRVLCMPRGRGEGLGGGWKFLEGGTERARAKAYQGWALCSDLPLMASLPSAALQDVTMSQKQAVQDQARLTPLNFPLLNNGRIYR